MSKKSIFAWPVRKVCCLSCPFRIDPLTGEQQNPELAAEVQTRLLDASQICHHPRIFGRKEFELCRGARDWQIMIFYRLGFIREPTDEAWEQKKEEVFRPPLKCGKTKRPPRQKESRCPLPVAG